MIIFTWFLDFGDLLKAKNLYIKSNALLIAMYIR